MVIGLRAGRVPKWCQLKHGWCDQLLTAGYYYVLLAPWEELSMYYLVCIHSFLFSQSIGIC